MLGEEGLGKNYTKYQIIDIRNIEGMSVLEGKMINMDKYVVHSLYDYLMFRIMRIKPVSAKTEVMMTFDTPLTLKYQQEFLQDFRIDAILGAIRRRIFMLDCFEGIESDILEQVGENSMPQIRRQEHRLASVNRYSARKDEKMTLRGLKGYVLFEGITEDSLVLLLTGELIHIGKNTSFGFGRYHLRFF